jgi:hypothetical protein
LVAGDSSVAYHFLLNHLIGLAVQREELSNHHSLTDATGFNQILFLNGKAN